MAPHFEDTNKLKSRLPIASKSTTKPSTNPLLTNLLKDGFVIIPSALNEEELISFRNCAAHITQQAREGSWPFIRTLPKAFPPWPADPSNGIWGVQHLLHPKMPNRGEFLKAYFGDAVMKPAMQLMECDEDELVMELFNLLVRPEAEFELRWHRDDVPPTATPEEELEALGLKSKVRERAWHTQWNMALYPDESLRVVPGSHLRARTEIERNAEPMAAELPDMSVVKLHPGDVVFYNNNILHRGVYDPTKERLTLHGSVGRSGGANERARNVLQHGIGSWVDNCDVTVIEDEEIRKRAEAMKSRLVEMGRTKMDVGFSQPDE